MLSLWLLTLLFIVVLLKATSKQILNELFKIFNEKHLNGAHKLIVVSNKELNNKIKDLR